jgi:hypothetical protein
VAAAQADSVNLREPFPFGLDEYGRDVQLRLLSRNLILGGAPDAGKSASLRVVAAAAALDPRAKLWMMDAKTGGAEFVHWAPAAEEVVRGRDLTAAVEMLARLEERIELRGQEIVARGEVFVCEDMELDVLMIDELPQFTRSFEGDSKEQASAVKTIKQSIWRLIALGRWAGMITVLSAQKPTADIVPSESRDLIDLKFALHCNTRQMSDAILGDGSGGETPVNAAEIPTGQPGVGYLLAGDEPRKMRTYFISHEQALEVASRAPPDTSTRSWGRWRERAGEPRQGRPAARAGVHRQSRGDHRRRRRARGRPDRLRRRPGQRRQVALVRRLVLHGLPVRHARRHGPARGGGHPDGPRLVRKTPRGRRPYGRRPRRPAGAVGASAIRAPSADHGPQVRPAP